MMKQETLGKKIKRIEDTFDRMERGMYTGVSIGWVIDQIAWLWKYRYIDHDKLNELSSHAMYVMYLVNPD